ncbi:MAG: hypothetical protein ACR2QO_23400 [Acidimicrobiales bacterium]
MTALLRAVRRWFRRARLAEAEAAPRSGKPISGAEASFAEGAGNASHQWQHNTPW